MDHVVGERAPASLRIHDFDLHQGDISPVGLPARRVLYLGEPDGGRLSCCLYGVARHFLACVVAYSLDIARLEGYALGGEEEVVVPLEAGNLLAVEEELD